MSLRQLLVDDWRQASRWWSVRINAVGAVVLPLLTMVPSMPPEIQAVFPLKIRAILVGLWCASAIAARMIAQKKSSG